MLNCRPELLEDQMVPVGWRRRQASQQAAAQKAGRLLLPAAMILLLCCSKSTCRSLMGPVGGIAGAPCDRKSLLITVPGGGNSILDNCCTQS